MNTTKGNDVQYHRHYEKSMLQDKKPTTIEIKRGGKTIFKPKGLVHEKLPRIFKALLRGDRVMLVGGAGSGKTYMAQQLQEMLGTAFKQKKLCSRHDWLAIPSIRSQRIHGCQWQLR